MLNDLFFPGVIREKWQMMEYEQIALTGILARLRPKGALEIGVYYGGSLSLTSQFSTHVIAIDIDKDVPNRFRCPSNVDLRIGSSRELVPAALRDFQANKIPLNYILIDADHTRAGVRSDIESVLEYRPEAEPLVILMHDSGNAETRAGILEADWSSNPHVRLVECDFIPAQIIEHSVDGNRGEIWAGLALAYLDPVPRTDSLEVRQGAITSIRCLQKCAQDLSIIDRPPSQRTGFLQKILKP